MEKKKVCPFSNGTEYMIFEEMNCWKCKKDFNEENPEIGGINHKCEIEQALAVAYVSDGLVSEEIAIRMGLGNGYKAWDGKCPEIELIESEK